MNQIAKGNSHLNLQGVLVGDGAIDPLTQFTGFSDLAFYMGFADLCVWFEHVYCFDAKGKRNRNERAVMKEYEAQITSLIGQQNWKGAFEVFDRLLNG